MRAISNFKTIYQKCLLYSSELLMKNIGLKDKAKVIDLTRKAGTVETLTEARINCTMEEKVCNLQ